MHGVDLFDTCAPCDAATALRRAEDAARDERDSLMAAQLRAALAREASLRARAAAAAEEGATLEEIAGRSGARLRALAARLRSGL